jgi:AcrR family transcriptional regulator
MRTRVQQKFDDLPELQVMLLDAAAEAFARIGFSATTIDQIADSIGVTKGSVYYYYKSKTDLFFSVHRKAMEINLATVTPIAMDATLDPGQRLLRMAREHTLLMMEHHSYQRVTVQGLELYLTGSTSESQRQELAELVGLRDRYEELFRSVVEEGISAGLFRPVESHLLVKPLLGALNWTTMWYRPRQGETPAMRQTMADEIAAFALAGVSGRQ